MKTISVGGLTYLKEAQAIIAMKSSADLFKEPDEIKKIENYEIVPWGDDNNLPATVIEKMEKSEMVSSNLEFNVNVGYGTGVKPMRRVIEDNKIVGYEDVFDGPAYEFFEDNDIQGYFLEQLTDLKAFYNVFPEIVISNDKKKITSIRSKEAVFSRWGKAKDGKIPYHYYSAKWGDNPTKKDIVQTDVLDRFNPKASLEEYLRTGKYKNLRFIVPVNFPTPGRTYYQHAYWWSIFQSGWYDFSVMIPEAKKALMKNGFMVKKIIYLSPKYFESIFKEEGIDRNDKEAVQARVDKEHQNFNDFLTGSDKAGKGLVSQKEIIHSANGAKEEKYIEIVDIDTGKGGEFIEDSEEASNVISYAMGVHSSLIGSTPGKNKGSFSGTDKRELFLMKQALMKPFRDRLLRPLNLVKRFNGWDNDTVIAVPDIEFTTLDQNKSGQQETTKE
ncbi:hypothetical protein [Draconibacterium orientale]|uniref:hypothetical protein n=1 Tax=Draconibacterium orientale TaxID=1168034 RepID=UPI0029BFFF86|nr:hypothetical protein [Draconibacterium orientale]